VGEIFVTAQVIYEASPTNFNKPCQVPLHLFT